MVVLLAAILTKPGKVLVSRQYRNMNRMRVEGILAIFPKLLQEASSQHTFTEANSVRYVYQPIENLIVLVVTTKTSNIIEDLETLRTIAKIIPEYAGSVQEEAVVDHAFEIVFALDEVITFGGMHEPITLKVVRDNLAMESHEEKLLAMVQESKQNQAREMMRQKQKELAQQEKQASAAAGGTLSYLSSFLSSTISSVAGRVQAPAAPMYAPVTQESSAPTLGTREADLRLQSSSLGEGMKLGGASRRDATLSSVVAEDQIVQVARPKKTAAAAAAAGKGAAPVEVAAESQEKPIAVWVEEALKVQFAVDGFAESVEIEGNLRIKANQEEGSRVRLVLNKFDAGGFKLVPSAHIDKAALNDQVVMWKGGGGFPVNTNVRALKWVNKQGDEEMLPVVVTCLPSPQAGGFAVEVSYTIRDECVEHMEGMTVSIPLPAGTSPEVTAVDGNYHYFPNQSRIEWTIEDATVSGASGVMQFNIGTGPEEDLFPISVSFQCSKPILDLKVEEVRTIDDGSSVDFYEQRSLKVSEYTIGQS